MEKCPTWEADSHSVTIFSTFRKTSGSLMDVYMQNHILIYWNIIFLFKSRSLNLSLPFSFMGYHFVYVLMHLWILCIELALCQPSGTLHYEVTLWFLEYLCIPAVCVCSHLWVIRNTKRDQPNLSFFRGKHHKSQSSVLFSFYLTYRKMFCLKLYHSVPEVTSAAFFIKTNCKIKYLLLKYQGILETEIHVNTTVTLPDKYFDLFSYALLLLNRCTQQRITC